MQVTVNSSLKCSVEMDTIGVDMYTSEEGLHLYKDMVLDKMKYLDDSKNYIHGLSILVISYYRQFKP